MATGIIVASQTPAIEVDAAPAPSATLSRTGNPRARAELSVPEIAAGTIATSESAFALRSLTPKNTMRMGTAIKPPPTPSKPAMNPIAQPTTRSSRIVAIDHSSRTSRLGRVTKTMTAVATSRAMNVQRRLFTFHRRSASVPRGAVAMPPAAMTAPKTSWSTGRLPETTNPSAPMVAVGMIAASDMTVARLWSTASSEMSSGTMTIPPPTPKNPENTPATAPIAAKDHQEG